MFNNLPVSLEEFLRGLRRMVRKSRAWAARSPGEFLAAIKALPASLKAFVRGIPRFASRHRALTVAVLTAVFLAGSFFPARWAYGKWRVRQAQHLTDLAVKYAGEGKFGDALMSLETALWLNPGDTVALRVMAKIRKGKGDRQEAIESYQRLLDAGGLTGEDFDSYFRLALQGNDWGLAERLADRGQGQQPALNHMLKADIATRRGDIGAATLSLRRAADADTTPRNRLELAVFLANTRRTREDSIEAYGIFKDLHERKDAFGAQAIVAGIESRLVPRTEMPGWLRLLRENPQATPQMLLLADSAQIRLDPVSKHLVVAKVTARVYGGLVPERAAAMAWMLQQGEPAQAARLLSREEAARDKTTFALWLNALALAGRHEEILAALPESGNPLPAYLAQIYRARALDRTGHPDEAAALYAAACSGSESHPDDHLHALAFLDEDGQTALFERALAQLFADPKKAVPALRFIAAVVRSHRDAARTRRVYELASSAPAFAGDLTVRNELDHLGVLLDMPVDIGAIALRSKTNPQDFSFRVTHALALLRAGEKKRAMDELDNCEPDVDIAKIPPQQQAVVAAVLAANGRKEGPVTAAHIPGQALSRQEVGLLLTYVTLRPKRQN